MNWVNTAIILLIILAIVVALWSLVHDEKSEDVADCGRSGGKCTGDDPSCECRECVKPIGCPNCDHYRRC